MMGARKAGLRVVAAGIVVATFMIFVQGCKGRDEQRSELPAVIKATATGSNICLGCSLKKEKGAGSQCSIFGHKHALKVTRVVSEAGKDVADLSGVVLHYLETEKSQELIKKHHGATLTITGKVYPLERVLEVESYEESGS